MFIKNFKKALPYLMKGNIATMLIGHHGVGKSQSVRDFCVENKFHFMDLRLGTMDTGDLIGLAEFERDAKGNAIATNFMPPKWVKNVVDFAEANPDKWAVVFLDEINRARRDVLQAIFQLVLDKRMHTVQLPKNVHIIAAMNPNTEDYIVTDIADKALMDRFCHIKLQPSTAEWFDYAKGRKMDGDLVQFLREQPDMLAAKCEDFGLDEVKPSRRSWEAVNRLIDADTPPEILQELCYGLVGHTATAAFMASLKNAAKPIPASEVVANYDKVRDKVKEYADYSNNRMDLLKHTSENLHELLEGRKKKLEAKEVANVSEFLTDIPADLSFSLCRDLYLIPICREVIDNNTKLKDMLKKAKGVK